MLKVIVSIASIRTLLFGVVAVGVLASQSAQGTLAFFTASTSSDVLFTSGSLNLSGTSLPSTASLSWSTTGRVSATNCGVIGGATTGIDTQGFAPNEQCTQVLTVTNGGNLTANARVRIYRATAAGTAANDALNDRLTLSLAELTAGTDTSGCTNAANFATLTPGTWTVLQNAAVLGSGGVGLTGGGATPGTSVADAAAGTAVKDLWGGSGVDNAPDSTKQLGPATSRNFCLRIAFPNAGVPASNTSGDNLAQGGTNSYYFKADLIQAAGR